MACCYYSGLSLQYSDKTILVTLPEGVTMSGGYCTVGAIIVKARFPVSVLVFCALTAKLITLSVPVNWK